MYRPGDKVKTKKDLVVGAYYVDASKGCATYEKEMKHYSVLTIARINSTFGYSVEENNFTYTDEMLEPLNKFKLGDKITDHDGVIGEVTELYEFDGESDTRIKLISEIRYDGKLIKELVLNSVNFDKVEEKQVWKPKFEEEVAMLYASGNINMSCKYYGNWVDKNIYAQSNIAPATEEGRKHLEWLAEHRKVEKELRDCMIGNGLDSGGAYMELQYDVIRNEISTAFMDYRTSSIHFTSAELAEKAIETIGEERLKRYWFGVAE